MSNQIKTPASKKWVYDQYSDYRPIYKIVVDKKTGHRSRVICGRKNYYEEIQAHKESTHIKDKIVIEGQQVYMPEAIMKTDKGQFIDETLVPKNAYEAKQMAEKHKKQLEWNTKAIEQTKTKKAVKKALKQQEKEAKKAEIMEKKEVKENKENA